MKLVRKLTEKWRAWHLRRDIESGRVLRGRQPSKGEPGDGIVVAKVELKPTITMRVFRAATQMWEDIPTEV